MSDATPSRLDDYLDVFVAPSKLFTRRSDGKFGQGLLILIVVSIILYFGTKSAMQPVFDAEYARGAAAALKANPQITPEQMETGRKFAQSFGAVFVIVGLPIGVLLLGVAVWIAAKVVGKSVSYAQGATIATFAMFPKLIDGVSGALQALLMDEASITSRFKVSLGLGRFLDPATTGATTLALLGRVDLFTLWATVLVAIGIKVMTKASTTQAAAAGALVWVLGALPTLLQALRSG